MTEKEVVRKMTDIFEWLVRKDGGICEGSHFEVDINSKPKLKLKFEYCVETEEE